MNIVVLHYHRIGGSGIVAYEIGRAMAEERGHKVHFMGLEPPFRLGDNYTEQMRFHKVWVKEYAVFDHQPYALALASQLVDIIRDHDIDVIHSHYALPHAVAAILAREMALDMLGKKVRCVTTLHGTDITVVGSHPSMKNITRHAIEKSDAVVAVSDYLKHETVRHFGTAPEKITTIYNFINPQFFNPGYRSESHCPRKKGCRTIVHISNLREVKDPFAVIRIFHGMIQEMPKLELFIVGEGPLEVEMIRLVKELKIEKDVKFLGIRSNIAPILATSDLFLLPSKQESFGLAALESMACGTPVLATRSGGIPEVIEDGVDGLLYEPENIPEAVKKGLALLRDDAAYEQMRQAALKSAIEKFSMKMVIDQYEAIYR